MTENPDHLAERDEVADAIFERIMADEARADETFARVFTTGHVLAQNDPAPEPRDALGPVATLPHAPATDGPPAHRFAPRDYSFQRGDRFAVTDEDGDTFKGVFEERICSVHGREGVIVFGVNQEAYHVPTDQIPAIIAWLSSRYARAMSLRKRKR